MGSLLRFVEVIVSIQVMFFAAAPFLLVVAAVAVASLVMTILISLLSCGYQISSEINKLINAGSFFSTDNIKKNYPKIP